MLILENDHYNYSNLNVKLVKKLESCTKTGVIYDW